MTTIVESSWSAGPVQACGRQYVLETHVDDAGVIYTAEYLAGKEVDRDAVMAARAVEIDEAVSARDSGKQERGDAQAAVDVVLKQAVKEGKLNPDVIGKAGYESEVAADVAEVAAEAIKP